MKIAWPVMRRRRTLSIVLLVLGCLAVPFALTGVWLKVVLLDTDAYVAAVSPLIERPAVRDAVANALSDQIIAGMDLQNRAKDLLPVLPGALGQLAGPLIAQVDYYTRLICSEFVASDAFRPIWDASNREAHRIFVAAVKGEGPLEVLGDGVIALNLDQAAAELNRRFHDASIPLPSSLIPSVPSGKVEVAVIDAGPFLTLRPLLHWLSRLYIVLPVLAAALLAGGVLLSRRHLWSLASAGGGLVVLMVGFQLGRIRGSSAYHEAAARAGVPPDISNALWGPLIGGLDLAARITLIFGVVMALVGLIAVFWHRGR